MTDDSMPTGAKVAAEGEVVAGAAPGTAPVVHDPHGAHIVYFDGCSPYGHYNGIFHFTLWAHRFLPSGTGQNDVQNDLVSVACLRTNLPGLLELRRSIDGAILAATPPSGEAN